jgi:hypothetical protein
MKTYNCLNCGTEKKARASYMNKYCSNKCQRDYQHKGLVEKWKAGGDIGKPTLKRYLTETEGHRCYVCGITEWQGSNIVFDLEHKNGHSWDNSHDNVALICPNCHSQTDTYKGKNVGNGRYTRRERYQEGKSY